MHNIASSRSVWLVSLMCFSVALVCVAGLPLVGSVPLSLERAWSGQQPDSQILRDLRIPRVLLSLLTGGALALAGVLFQALLRNALATPYTLGVSSGAALGAVVAICFALPSVWMASVAGAGLTLFLVLGTAAKRRRMSSFTLLLAGVTINSIATAAILFLQSVATLGQSLAITRWLMGGIEAIEYGRLTLLALTILPIAGYSYLHARHWNLLAVGEEWAAARGVATARFVLVGYLLGSLLTGSVTALTGPIGFVGLIVPHAVRLMLGADHRLLIPASFFLGGAFLAVCDTIARVIVAPNEVPVGVITAIVGGPVFIWMLRSH